MDAEARKAAHRAKVLARKQQHRRKRPSVLLREEEQRALQRRAGAQSAGAEAPMDAAEQNDMDDFFGDDGSDHEGGADDFVHVSRHMRLCSNA